MVKTLYHGSKDIIEHPRYGAGKPYNDYGGGFIARNLSISRRNGGGRRSRRVCQHL